MAPVFDHSGKGIAANRMKWLYHRLTGDWK